MKRLFLLAGILTLWFLSWCAQTSAIPEQTLPTVTETTTKPSIDSNQMPTTTPPSWHTLQDVQKHTTSNDCRTIIDGKIYDVSSFSSKHPGGADPILSVCGKDWTVTFNGQHHMNFSMLQKFFVADVILDRQKN